MKKLYILSLAQAVALTILFSGCKSTDHTDGAYDVNVKLRKEERYSQQVTTTMNLKEGILNSNMQVESKSEFEVIKAASDEKQLQLVYRKLHTVVGAGSDEPADKFEDSIMNVLNSLILSKPVLFTINESNRVSAISGLQEITEAANVEPSGKRSLDSMAHSDMSNILAFMLGSAQAKEMKTGESWTSVIKFNLMGTDMTITLKHTLSSIKDGLAEITLNGKVSGNGNLRINNENIIMTLSGSQVGTIYLDLEEGTFKNGNYTINVNGESDIMGTIIPMTLRSVCEIKKI